MVSLIELYVTEVNSLMQGEWSCYRGGHFNGSASSNWRRENAIKKYVTEVVE